MRMSFSQPLTLDPCHHSCPLPPPTCPFAPLTCPFAPHSCPLPLFPLITLSSPLTPHFLFTLLTRSLPLSISYSCALILALLLVSSLSLTYFLQSHPLQPLLPPSPTSTPSHFPSLTASLLLLTLIFSQQTGAHLLTHLRVESTSHAQFLPKGVRSSTFKVFGGKKWHSITSNYKYENITL
jgi:hypothetical protein